jgi:hypothetical protein
MKSSQRIRNSLLRPLVYLAAIVLIIEEWFWDAGGRLVRMIAGWPPIKALEERIRALPPYGALCVFVLPAVLLFPVKILALYAIASGFPVSGMGIFVVAKLAGAAAVARLYAITRPTLMSLSWFARWHDKFMAVKDRWIGALRASEAYRYTSMVAARLRRVRKDIAAALAARLPRGRHANRHMRMVRRLLAIRRARRR